MSRTIKANTDADEHIVKCLLETASIVKNLSAALLFDDPQPFLKLAAIDVGALQNELEQAYHVLAPKPKYDLDEMN